MTKRFHAAFTLLLAFLALLVGFFYVPGISERAYAQTLSEKSEAESAGSEAVSESLGKSRELLSYLEKNFPVFVGEYNAAHPENMLSATSIEFSQSVYCFEEETYGLYLDFDGECGYAVITGENMVLELCTDGDLPKLRDEETLIYSRHDGFVSYDEDGTLQRVFDDEDDGKRTDSSAMSANSDEEADQDGKFSNDEIDDYVAEQYPDYVLSSVNESLAESFDFASQLSTTYYMRYNCTSGGTRTGGWLTEGNCSLTAMFNVLRSWEENGKVNGIDCADTVDVWNNIEADSQYRKYGDGDVFQADDGTWYIWLTNSEKNEDSVYYLKILPELYANIRAYAITNNGYTPLSGYSFSDVPETMADVASECYGVSIKTKKTSSVSSAISAIDDGEAAYISINGSKTYGNHGSALIGYREYSYTASWWIFSSTSYLYFYQLADGHSTEAQYFDPNTDAEPTVKFCILNN